MEKIYDIFSKGMLPIYIVIGIALVIVIIWRFIKN